MVACVLMRKSTFYVNSNSLSKMFLGGVFPCWNRGSDDRLNCYKVLHAVQPPEANVN